MHVVPLLLLFGCGSEPPAKDPARPFDYQVWFDTDDVAVQSQLTWKGQPAGRVTQIKTWEAGKELSFGTITLPMNWKEDPAASLGLLALTPCGPREVPLQLDGQPTATIKLLTPSADALPKATLVYQPWGRGVSIGQAELLPAGNAWSVAGLDCAPEHDVTVNGTSVGTMTTPADPAYVLLAPPDDCFVYTVARFTKDGGGVREVPLSGALAYGLEGEVNRPFADVPTTIRTDETTAKVGTVSSYLTQVACGG